MDTLPAIAERVRHLEMKRDSVDPYVSNNNVYDRVNRRLDRLDLITQGWDDCLYQLVGQKLESPSSDIELSAAESAIVMEKTCAYPTDYVTMTIQIPHRWRVGTAIYPHLHWWQEALAMPHLMIGYRWQKQGAVKTTSWTIAKHSSNSYTWSTGVLNQITQFGSIAAPSGAGISDCIQFRIYRDVADDSDLWNVDATPVAEVDVATQDNVYAVNFDIHYQVDSAGSLGEYTK
jgi:hypothetical protein